MILALDFYQYTQLTFALLIIIVLCCVFYAAFLVINLSINKLKKYFKNICR